MLEEGWLLTWAGVGVFTLALQMLLGIVSPCSLRWRCGRAVLWLGNREWRLRGALAKWKLPEPAWAGSVLTFLLPWKQGVFQRAAAQWESCALRSVNMEIMLPQRNLVGAKERRGRVLMWVVCSSFLDLGYIIAPARIDTS